jgi:hypothetical protein
MQGSNTKNNEQRCPNEGMATRFIGHEAETHRFRWLAAPIAVRAFAMDAEKPNNRARLSRNRGKTPF